MQSSELQAQEEARAAELLERLLTDAEFRTAFRMDPAGACAAFDLPELAEEFSAGAGAGKALHTLEIRESRSSLAGAFMAAASEGTGAVDHLKNLHDQHLHGGAHRVVHKALTSPRLAAVDPHHLHSGGAGVHELVDSSAGGASRGGGAAVHLASTQDVQGLLHNSHVQLSPEAHAALVRGGADVRLVGTLDELAKDHQLRIGTLHVGKEGTGSFEILSVDGERVSETNIAARDLANELASLDPSLRPANIITPWPIAGEGFSTSGLHEDRIQIVFGAPAAGGHAVAAAPVLESSTAAPAPLSDPVAPPPEPSTPATPTTTAPPSTPPPTPTTPPPADTGTPPPEPSTPAAPPADTSTPPPPPAPTTPPPVTASAPPPPVDPEPAAAPPPADTGTPPPAAPAPADTGTPPPAAPAPADTGTPPPAAPGTPPPAPAAPPPPAPAPPPVPTTPAPTAPDAGAGPPPEPATPPAAPTTPPPEPVTPVTAPAAGPSHQSLVIGAVPVGSDPGHSTLQFQIPDSQGGGAGGGAALVGAFDPNAPGGLPDASDAYPGDDAGKEAIAAWMGRQAHKAGLPAELPIMAALTESGLTNVNYGDRDSLGFFQMRTSIWDQGEYKGFADHPELQLKWFIDHAVAVRRQAVERGDTNFGQDKSQWGDWVADVERPAAEYRYRYATHLAEADGLLAQAGAAGGTTPGADPSAVAEAFGGAAGGGSAVGVQALMIAEKFKGTPYHWGGASPETGFDCSGLVQYSYHQLGIDLPRVTTGQFGVGVHVPTVDQLKPGDIVFFKDSTGYIHHEGIYIGNHMFLHAPHTGDVIKVSSLDEPYYAQQFAGGSDVSGLATGAVPPAGVAPPVTPPVEPATPAPPDAADAGSSEPGSGDSGLFGAVPDSGKSSGGTRSTVQILPAVEDPNAPSDD